MFTKKPKDLNKEQVFRISQEFRKDCPILSHIDLDVYYDRAGVLGIENLYGIKFAEKIKHPYTVDGFMEYVSNAYKEVNERVANCYSCL